MAGPETTEGAPQGATARMARHAAALRYEQLPADVAERATITLLDTIGVILAGSATDIGQRVVRMARELAPGDEATVFAKGAVSTVPGAALANGTLSDLLESQDGWRFGGLHPSLVIASALAIAESRRLSGRELIAAIVCGYEVANRVAATAHPYHMAGGYMPNGTAGSIGAAAAAASGLGLEAEAFANALGIAGFLLPVSTAENLWEGYSSKSYHTGYAARTGVEAALLAQGGFDACGIEGSAGRGRGFMEIMNKRAPDLAPMTRGWGEWFTMRETYFKFYPACRLGHAAIEAAVELSREAGFDTWDVESIEIRTFEHAAKLLDRYIEPGASMSAAQYSLPYCIAVAMADKAYAMPQLATERRSDAAVLQLARRASVVADADMTAKYPDSTPGGVVVLLKDGRRVEKSIAHPPGDPRRDVTAQSLFDKFDAFVSPVIGAAAAEALRAEVMAIGAASDVRETLARIRWLVNTQGPTPS